MATLVSAGVSVTVTDESFFIPAAAPTVPLIFIATADQKLQPDGVSPAEGTYEHDVVRTVTSLNASVQLYGFPNFLRDSTDPTMQYHGDARNEYGLFALNQYLGVGNRAYVIRANVNLNDDIDDLQDAWDALILDSQVVLENLVNEYLTQYNATNNLIPSDPGYKDAVSASELLTLIDEAAPWLDPTTGQFNFKNVHDYFLDDQSSSPLSVYGNGFDQAATGTFCGVTWILENIGTAIGSPAAGSPAHAGSPAAGSPAGSPAHAGSPTSTPSGPGGPCDATTYPTGSPTANMWNATQAGDFLVAVADDFKYTREFLDETRLGTNDTTRRTAIVTALQASINSNTDIRSDTFDYNLVLCPGYPEVVDELLALVVDIQSEALVIADTPVDEDPDGITNPSTGWAVTTARQRSPHVAYYYPWGLASNLDGYDVTIAPSGIALRTYAFSDDQTFLWFAPAGLRRGLITGISNLGYVSGTLGTVTEFVPVALNQGQRDALYQYAASGDINPLVFFPGQGFVVWGQKTSAAAASALDRVNVSRLVKYIKRQLRRNTRSFVFEPNDTLTRDNLKAVVDNFLGDLVVKRGLYDFATICDESNNTPDRIDRNEMYIDVALKPVKAAEFIYIPIRILSTGAEFTF